MYRQGNKSYKLWPFANVWASLHYVLAMCLNTFSLLKTTVNLLHDREDHVHSTEKHCSDRHFIFTHFWSALGKQARIELSHAQADSSGIFLSPRMPRPLDSKPQLQKSVLSADDG
ncbi:hypothetical protein BD289DRAFT_30822 [Coniella lustricola]|uniref:Uncharacterized protein n=1 Tax=Coniella lustricola TaxID=2025994 RepID=A0A2T3A331_9PEZI|nr:hypothetical protein BD289DRAFT_30822 [Coniella lustricola]